MCQIEIQKTLINYFEAKQKINPSYSLRAFAKKLGLAPGALSHLMSGGRKISKKMALRLATILELEGKELEQFISSFSSVNSPNHQATNLEYVKLQMDQYAVISKWYHMAIMSLVKLDDFQYDTQWISKRLGITVEQTQKAIARLINIGLLEEAEGTIRRTIEKFETSDDIANLSLRSAHKENLQLAINAIDEVAVEKRDISAMTFAIDLKKLPEAKKKIRNFQDELAEFLTAGKKEEVYKLTMQLFPLTKLGETI